MFDFLGLLASLIPLLILAGIVYAVVTAVGRKNRLGRVGRACQHRLKVDPFPPVES